MLRDTVRTVGEQGWALVDEELELGLRSIAAPLHDGEGRVFAALNLSAAAPRVPVAELEGRLLPSRLATAEALSTAIGRSARSRVTSAGPAF